MKTKLKEEHEQWDSIAVITVMEKGGKIMFTSEGCGEAGEWCDALINVARHAAEGMDEIEVLEDSE